MINRIQKNTYFGIVTQNFASAEKNSYTLNKFTFITLMHISIESLLFSQPSASEYQKKINYSRTWYRYVMTNFIQSLTLVFVKVDILVVYMITIKKNSIKEKALP